MAVKSESVTLSRLRTFLRHTPTIVVATLVGTGISFSSVAPIKARALGLGWLEFVLGRQFKRQSLSPSPLRSRELAVTAVLEELYVSPKRCSCVVTCRRNPMANKSKTKDKVENPEAHFAKPKQVVKDKVLTHDEKKNALNTWEQDE